MASYFTSYFQASSMPKRLLQYALSRLEVLDTTTLDLEKLDIAWGKNSTFEFRDVGLRLKKLETLIQLPAQFEISKARVLLLRITIPVDIYSTPISVDVDGVQGQIRVRLDTNNDTVPAISRTNHDRNQRNTKAAVGTSSHNRTGHFDAVLPTPADLAESFLETGPEDERAQLEAVMLTETRHLSESVTSDDGNGEESVGTGAPLSLPVFLTTFLQGIVDRLKLRICGITFDLEVDLPCEDPGSSDAQAADSVTVQVTVDRLDVYSVAVEPEALFTGDGEVLEAPLDTKRIIRISNIRGVLTSEASFFSGLAKSSALSSPSAAHSEMFRERRPSIPCRHISSPQRSVIRPVDGSTSPPIVSSPRSRSFSTTPASRIGFDSGMIEASIAASGQGRFDDAPEDDEDNEMSGSLHDDEASEISDSVYRTSEYLNQFLAQEDVDVVENNDQTPSSNHRSVQANSKLLSTSKSRNYEKSLDMSMNFTGSPESHSSMLESSILPDQQHSRFSHSRISHSQRSQLAEDGSHKATHGFQWPPVMATRRSFDNELGNGDEDGCSTPIGEDDLIQSQLFSHEDAESMYMSAVSHGSFSGGFSGDRQASNDGNDEPTSGTNSTSALRLQETRLDNLENARKIISPIAQTPAKSGGTKALDSSSMSQCSSGRIAMPTPAIAEDQSVLPMKNSSSSVSGRSVTSSDEYPKLSKQFLNLDMVNIYLPSMNHPPVSHLTETVAVDSVMGSLPQSNNAAQSVSINVPGAFSSKPSTRSTPRSIPVADASRLRVIEPHVTPQSGTGLIHVALGNLFIHFDMSVGRLSLKLISTIKNILKDNSPLQTNQQPLSQNIKRNIKLTIKTISAKFLERLDGVVLSSKVTPDWNHPSDSEILLQTTLNGFTGLSHSADMSSKISLSLGKFRFGYAKEDIISFDASPQMNSSRDLNPSDGVDLIVNITNSQGTTRCDITTLPMHVSVGLQRLDETFSWFGGLSSVLNLGSSIASNTTVTTAFQAKPKSRGVSFEAPMRPGDKSLASQNKADLRLGGLVLRLIGSECSVEVQTSAIKIVSRGEGIGLFVQKTRLSGPHLSHSNEAPAINVDILSTRIEYLPSPTNADLDRLLSLITPSKAKYDQDDDILLDTLLRQRKQGAVLRVTLDELQTQLGKLHELSYLPDLGEEVSKLATVAKYLPDDDRPGLLSLLLVHKFQAHIKVDDTIGIIHLSMMESEVAQISLPSLMAISVTFLSAKRNGTEELIGAGIDPDLRELGSQGPALMARMIGDEMEPVIKVKLWNLKLEYRVSTLIALLGLAESVTTQDLSKSLANSIATLTELTRSPHRQPKAKGSAELSDHGKVSSKSLAIDIVMRDCIFGLNPLGLPSKVLVVLTEAHVVAKLPKDHTASASMELNKASLLVVDNVAHLTAGPLSPKQRGQHLEGCSSQVADLSAMGFVSVSYISSAKAVAQLSMSEDGENAIDVELRDDLFVLESCADSTQTLIATLNGLTPPTPPSKDIKYRTEIMPVEDLLASLSGDAFGTAEGTYNFDDDFGHIEGLEIEDPEGEDDLDFDSRYYHHDTDRHNTKTVPKQYIGYPASVSSRDTSDGVLLQSLTELEMPSLEEPLEFHDDHFGTGAMLEGTAHRWNSAKNTYDKSNAQKVKNSPLTVRVRDVHVIWHLFDGYDWQSTRETIAKAVQELESKAIEKRARNDRRSTFDQDIEDSETVVGDFLFNSIYVRIPANRDPHELAMAINQDLNDDMTETESVTTTVLSSSPSRKSPLRKSRGGKLHLKRSRHHKITFELKRVCVDLVTFPAGSGETQSSIDVRVGDLEIFDHVPTSTWRKFATYMQDAGERESGSNMIHIEILNVRPIADLAASEIVLKATILPLRLHVDQDALDFITRFFEFKDDSVPTTSSEGDVAFFQRVEVNSVQVKLDFKPKRVDYAGLRSGHTTEFMNFLILDEADMVLRHTIIYGISGFDKLGKTLNDIWMPDIKRNQLPGILAGLAPVRSLVNVGGGFRHLIFIPMQEYKKDGRIVRSISKGAAAFAKTTGTELVKLGAKVAIGMQTVLQGAEGLLSPSADTSAAFPYEDDNSDEERKQISLYANQPVGVLQGLRGGYAGLQRDLILARDAIIAVPGEIMEGGNAAGVLRAVGRHAPTVILRPAIGVAKAGGQILMGATNSLDPNNLQKADAKYKKH